MKRIENALNASNKLYNVKLFRLLTVLLAGLLLTPILAAAQMKNYVAAQNSLFFQTNGNETRQFPFKSFFSASESFTGKHLKSGAKAGNTFADASAVTAANGRIAFVSNRSGNYEIYTMNPGGGLVNLTNTASADEDSPAWSPDGSKLVYQRGGQIWTMNANGNSQTRVGTVVGDGGQIAWSPNGAKFVFVRHPNLWTMNVDGSGLAQLTTNGFMPAWSPDGLKVVFSSQFDDGGTFREEIFVVNSDGTNRTRLTNDIFNLDRWATWSPDGTKILFTSNRNAGANTANWEIYTMNTVDSDITRITNNNVQEAFSGWSPDGLKILFARKNTTNFDIYTANANGTGEIQLTGDNIDDFSPAWQPLVPTFAVSLTGLITENAGTPVANAVVSLTGTDITGTITATTDSAGFYTFDGLTSGGDYIVSLDPLIFMSPPQTVNNVQSNQTINFPVFRAQYSIRGTIDRTALPSNAPSFQIQLMTIGTGQLSMTTTDPNGNYNFFMAQAGRSYRIMPFPAGYNITPIFRDVTNLNGNRTAENFTATAQNYTISGNITRSGAALAGVSVNLSGGATGSMTTDANGNYSFSVAFGGSYTVTPQLANNTFTPTSRTFNSISSSQTADFAAQLPVYSIGGFVRYNPVNNTVVLSGATVTLKNTQNNQIISSTTTGAMGEYNFPNVPGGGDYTVTPSRSGFTFTPSETPLQNLNQNLSSVNFEVLNSSASISGRVGIVEPPGFTPLPNTTINLSSNSGTSRMIVSDNTGFYSFPNLVENAIYTLSVLDTNVVVFNLSGLQSIFLQGNRIFDIQGIRRFHQISGTIRQTSVNGPPLPLATVTLRRASNNETVQTTMTGGDGSYNFSNAQAGINYTVTPTLQNYSFNPLSVNVTNLNAPRMFVNFNAIVPTFADVTISGKVIADRASLAGAIVALSGARNASTVTDNDGRYSFNVPPNNLYFVSVSKAGFNFNPASRTFSNPQTDQTALDIDGKPLCAPPPSGLAVWYQGENNANDASGNGNAGTLRNGATANAPGKVRQAFGFDGVDDDVSVNGSSSLDVGAGGGLTVETWINTTMLASEQAVAEWNNDAFGVSLRINTDGNGFSSGRIFADVRDSNGNSHFISTDPAVLTANSLQHIALTYNKSDGVASLYRNGNLVKQQSLGVFTPQTSPSYNLYIGSRRANSYFQGVIDELKIFSRALTAPEIQTIFNTGSAGVCQSSTPTPTGPTQVSSNGVNLAFGNVTQPGSTTVETISSNSVGVLPSGYVLPPLAQQTAYEVSTSAAFAGAVDLTFNISAVPNAAACANLRILHFSSISNQFEDITLLPNQYSSSVCVVKGRTNSFSPTVVVEQTGPTAANVTVGGRVRTASGGGIRNAFVTITDSDGVSRTTLTGKFGNYRFQNVAAGKTYIFSVSARNYTFAQASQVHSINEDSDDINFVGSSSFIGGF